MDCFKKAFNFMLEDKDGLSEIDKVIKYSRGLEKRRAQHDKELMLSMKDRPISIIFIHEMKSIEVAKDFIALMNLKEAEAK